ncbi:hypothetical membrane protein (plasmid) [Pseudomonas veronii 1YdBTEX2]|uniref:Hypothetical membrane protein n=1 Tax=Pseudomonas veronii 1YdBTEX2 TaxID=1295141 RepID=A0A1D3KAI0_PSEVE|nr:hypothetical membrane protein [Pseudomonas veronii 1YdBTEX2]
MDLFVYVLAMICGSNQYESELFFSHVTVCIGTPLLTTLMFFRRCSSIKQSK